MLCIHVGALLPTPCPKLLRMDRCGQVSICMGMSRCQAIAMNESSLLTARAWHLNAWVSRRIGSSGFLGREGGRGAVSLNLHL